MISTSHTPFVVVVDDDPSVRRSLRRLVGSIGYEVESFSSGDAFLAEGIGGTADCLVFDIHMPGMDGFGLLKEIRASGIETAVVFISAHADTQTRARAISNGAVALLAKPFRFDDLSEVLSRGIKETLAARENKE